MEPLLYQGTQKTERQEKRGIHMQALVYGAPWKMTVEDLPRPTAGPGEVVIDVKAVGICGSDVHG
jgi:D-arabinose 1-dehydrogenase-like Zn-dependent alcohol dehydrogenase